MISSHLRLRRCMRVTHRTDGRTDKRTVTTADPLHRGGPANNDDSRMHLPNLIGLRVSACKV